MLDYISNYTTHKLKIIIHEHFVFEIFSSGEVKKIGIIGVTFI